MQYIDEKFKEESPAKTVEKIQNILNGIGIELEERWNDSGIENCWSLNISVKGARFPSANGKGITKEFARASAYGEFIERLQSGLFLYKYQSIERDEQMNLHSFAPDCKYMTEQELVENGEWMDYLIETYGGENTRESIAKQCKMYACTDEDRILTVPFYSLFEDKYVYLPAGFIEHMYSANGCCVGNARAEAWIHALSEILERYGDISMLLSGTSAPEIPEEVLNTFPTVSKILSDIRTNKSLDVKVFDFSEGLGIPVVSTRIINKKTQSYIVNTGADPVLEIAIERTLTEIFQGRNIRNFTSSNNGQILNKLSDFPATHNVLNLLETGNGLFTADFFAEEVTCQKKCSDFADNSQKSNKELLDSILQFYRTLNKPVYVRNYSFLGFHCYKFIVPGFSESRGMRLKEKIQEYALGDMTSKTLRNAADASAADLTFLLSFHKMMKTAFSRYNHFGRLAGLPIEGDLNFILLYITMSYAAYKLGRNADAINYLEMLCRQKQIPDEIGAYFSCVKQYLKLKAGEVSDDKIRIILNKFFEEEIVSEFYAAIDSGKTPYDSYLLKCDVSNCAQCKYNNKCAYTSCKRIIAAAGAVYNTFVDGQSKENFKV